MLTILDINLRAMVKVFLKFGGEIYVFWGKIRSNGETVYFVLAYFSHEMSSSSGAEEREKKK